MKWLMLHSSDDGVMYIQVQAIKAFYPYHNVTKPGGTVIDCGDTRYFAKEDAATVSQMICREEVEENDE